MGVVASRMVIIISINTFLSSIMGLLVRCFPFTVHRVMKQTRFAIKLQTGFEIFLLVNLVGDVGESVKVVDG